MADLKPRPYYVAVAWSDDSGSREPDELAELVKKTFLDRRFTAVLPQLALVEVRGAADRNQLRGALRYVAEVDTHADMSFAISPLQKKGASSTWNGWAPINWRDVNAITGVEEPERP